jgi:hypothetical protein
VPLFIDALRFDLWPLENTGPAEYEFAAWSGNNFGRCCINRHVGHVGVSFLDYSARKVGLKELWILKWHKSFNTSGPYTLAGGVQPLVLSGTIENNYCEERLGLIGSGVLVE